MMLENMQVFKAMIMQKLLPSFGLAVISLLLASDAEAQKLKYYYYPTANVYYNSATGSYIYFNNHQWITVNQLPGTVVLKDKPKKIVYYEGPDVWNHNTKVKSNNSRDKGKKKGWSKAKGNKH